MDFEKAKLKIIWKGNNLGIGLTEDGKNVDYTELTHDEQMVIIDALVNVRDFYLRLSKEE